MPRCKFDGLGVGCIIKDRVNIDLVAKSSRKQHINWGVNLAFGWSNPRTAPGLLCWKTLFSKPKKKSRRIRYIDYSQIRGGIENSWKLVTEPLAQSQVWIKLSFPRSRHIANNQHCSNLEFFNRIGQLLPVAIVSSEGPLVAESRPIGCWNLCKKSDSLSPQSRRYPSWNISDA